MYESPITQIIGETTNQMREYEEGRIVCEVSTAIGYDINKEELIKAMQYDRNQYEKGYKDGLAVLDKIRSEIVELQKDYHEYGWAYDDVLDIIDRYKAEGSDNE